MRRRKPRITAVDLDQSGVAPIRSSRRVWLSGALSSGVAGITGFGCATSPSSSSSGGANTPDLMSEPHAFSHEQTEPAKASSDPQAPNEPAARSGKQRLGVALVGLGDYSEKQLAPALRLTKHCELRGLVTGSPEKVSAWQQKFSIPDANVYDYESLPRIADNADIDVLYIVLPTSLHAKYSIIAAEAGKHVWCEKPMAMNVQECQAMIDACQKHRVSLSIGYRMQHEPNTRTIIEFARTKPYGQIRHIRAVAAGYAKRETGWRMDPSMGGGALYDMGVYSINAIRYASGEEPVRVAKARQWANRPEQYRHVDESTEFELELPSGATAYGKASRFDNENRLRVEAERGWYELQPMQTYEGVRGETSDGRQLNEQIDDQQARQMDNEALAILEGRPPVVPAEEGLRDVRLVEAILECIKRGEPVSL